MRVAHGMQVEPLAAAPHVEPERAVEALGLVEVGHGEDEAVERVHAERAGRRVAADEVAEAVSAIERLLG